MSQLKIYIDLDQEK